MLTSFLIVFITTLSTFVEAVPIVRLHARGAFGSCSNPTIKFAVGLDGRREASFTPVNNADFNHGSALNIGVITSFICGQLQSKCKADASAITACAGGQSAASGLTGQAAADAFNAAINGASSNPIPVVSASTSSNVQAAPAAAATGSVNNASGGNLQTFSGTLGGAPPPVTAGGRGFVVDGSDFVNVGAALGRSCDVQHNACANAANSGGAFSVNDCDTQNSQCRAAIA